MENAWKKTLKYAKHGEQTCFFLCRNLRLNTRLKLSFSLAVQGQGLGPPTYQSDWLLIRAQDNSLSYLEVHHGLGQVPALVDILVKSTDQPNKDFIFKGIGSYIIQLTLVLSNTDTSK